MTPLDFIHVILGAIKSGSLPQVGYGSYIVLAVLVAIEGPIATLLGAAAASAGFMNPELVFLSAAGGNLCADVLWYTIGYAGRADWILDHSRWFGWNRSKMEHLMQEMHDHAPKVLFLAKLTAAFTIPSLIAAGFARVPIKRWMPFLATAETLWTGSLVIMGFYATESIKQIENGVQYVLLLGSIAFVILIIWIVLRRYIRTNAAYHNLFSDEEEENPQEGKVNKN
ncbi:MAG: VTT domain-containing protein [Anaerolineae bacterium]|nr:VTT domain-containing protein [Anaerolineae bacterium]